MGFLGIKGDTWKKIGKIALKVAPIAAAPFTGGASLLALGAGTGALSGALGGGGWKGALMGGALGAIPGGGAGGAVAGGAAKAGLKQIATGLGKGAITNFATGTGTGLATGQGLKQSLKGGAGSAVSGLGTTGGAGGFGQAAKTVGKNVAVGAGSQLAAKGLQKAGVPGAIASQGGNVFSQYLGNQFNGAPAGGNSLVQQPGAPAKKPGIASYLPQAGQSWQQTAINAGLGAVQGAQQGGGLRGALTGAATGATGQPVSGQPMYATKPQGGTVVPPGEGPMTFNLKKQGTSASGGGSTRPAGVPAGEGPATAPQTTAPASNDGAPQTWAERWGPLIAQGAGVAVGGAVGKLSEKNAMKRSPEEQAALAGAQGSAGQLGDVGGDLTRRGRDYLQKPGEYFQTLLGGNRAAMSQAVAGPTAQLTSTYRGAERNLQQQGVRGAARDLAASDLNRDRASKIAGLTTGVQPYAAEQLAKMGQDTTATGVGALGASGSLYQGLLGSGADNRKYARKEGADTAEAIGGLARDAGEVVFRKPQAKAVKKPPTAVTGGGMAPPPAQGGTLVPPGASLPINQAPVPLPGAPGGPGQYPDFRVGNVDWTGKRQTPSFGGVHF